MSHNHDHDHHHEHEYKDDHDAPRSMPFDEKMVKLLNHWVKHNDDHSSNYRDWAAKARVENLSDVAALLEETADMTRQISEKFETASKLIAPK